MGELNAFALTERMVASIYPGRCPGLMGVSLSGYCLADDYKPFSCVVIKDKNTFVGMMSALCCAYIDVVWRNVPVMQACR